MENLVWAEVDLEVIRHNYQELKEKLGDTKVMAVVKANAYGHGGLAVAKALANADFFGVSHLDEGILLRQGGITAPILMLLPALSNQYSDIVENDIIPTIDSIDNLGQLAHYGSVDDPQQFHLKINVGMNRFGVSYTDLEVFLDELDKYPQLKMGGVFSHLPTAMIKNSKHTKDSIELFKKCVDLIKQKMSYDFVVHLANSAATVSYSDAHFDMVRVGTLLFGQYPAGHMKGYCNLIDPFVVKSKVIAVHNVKPGDRIGYSGDYKVRKSMKVGVIPIGYTDGFGILAPQNQVTGKIFLRQSLKLLRNWLRGKSGNVVMYDDKSLPVLGKIAMQTSIIDVSDIDIKVGDVVCVLLRRTSLSTLIPRVYKNE